MICVQFCIVVLDVTVISLHVEGNVISSEACGAAEGWCKSQTLCNASLFLVLNKRGKETGINRKKQQKYEQKGLETLNYY